MRDEILILARRVLDACFARKLKIALAESCTGGLIAGALTEIAGSSDVFERGFVTYSNEAKQDLLDVPAGLIAAHGAVSAEVAEAMALGALAHSRAQLALSVTGIAGPGGGSAEKPVGLVHFGLAQSERPTLLQRKHFTDGRAKELSRNEIRRHAVLTGLQMLLEAAAPQLRA
ncbi:CinA family protein [Rhodoblastus sp.]|jgi:nicotinamide-nucleotide amidase|uniref:CinA family protein n=1 Tax=Rhodoblastus sp. TaxID=1962975 RepID=UPI0025FFDF4C|nr:CinA family protein [Rhodoblastus sp.]